MCHPLILVEAYFSEIFPSGNTPTVLPGLSKDCAQLTHEALRIFNIRMGGEARP